MLYNTFQFQVELVNHYEDADDVYGQAQGIVYLGGQEIFRANVSPHEFKQVRVDDTIYQFATQLAKVLNNENRTEVQTA